MPVAIEDFDRVVVTGFWQRLTLNIEGYRRWAFSSLLRTRVELDAGSRIQSAF